MWTIKCAVKLILTKFKEAVSDLQQTCPQTLTFLSSIDRMLLSAPPDPGKFFVSTNE